MLRKKNDDSSGMLSAAQSPSSGGMRPPPPEGKTDLLLRFFDSEFFDEWIAISYLWRTRSEGVIDYLCNRMYSLPDDRVERYLSQIIMLQILRPNASLERTIIDFCCRSIRLGTKTCWLLSAAAGDSKHPKPILELRLKCEKAALDGKWSPPFRTLSPMLDAPMSLGDHSPGGPRRALMPNGDGGVQEEAGKEDKAALLFEGDYGAEGLVTPTGSPSKMAGVFARDGEEGRGGVVDGDGGGESDGELGASLRKIRINGGKSPAAGEEGSFASTVTAEMTAEMSSQRRDTFTATIQLAEDLCGLSAKLATVFPQEGRQGALRSGIGRVSDALVQGHEPGAGVMFPMGGRCARVVRIPAEEAVLLNSREKAPYLLCLEVISPDGAGGSEDGSPGGSAGRAAGRGSGGEPESPFNDDAGASSVPLWSVSPTAAGAGVGGGVGVGLFGVGTSPQADGVGSVAAAAPPSASTPPLHPNGSSGTGGGGGAAANGRKERSAALTRAGLSLSSLDTYGGMVLPTDTPSQQPSGGGERRNSVEGANGLPSRRRPPLSPSLSPGQSPTAASAAAAAAAAAAGGSAAGAGGGGAAAGGAATIVASSHHRTKSFENISRKVDMALAQVWGGGDEPVVRVSLAVMAERTSPPGSTSGRGSSSSSLVSEGGKGEGDGEGEGRSSGRNGSGGGDGGGAGASGARGEEGGGSPGGSPKCSHVRVTLFVENPPAPKAKGGGRLGVRGMRSPPHQRTPSDVGLTEMAATINRQTCWAAPADARDVTAQPTPSVPPGSPLRPAFAGVGTATTPPRGAAQQPPSSQVPSPWKRSAGGLGEKWEDKVERVRTSSPYGDVPGWSLKPVIIKAGDNCRQELLAIQLAQTFSRIYSDAGLPLWLRPFEVIATSTTSAFIEAVTDAPSIHAIKSRAPRGTSLRQHFEAKFGGGGTPAFRTAQRNFVESLAGYSILTYILQVKDRHNGNILLHDDGHLIHIDFNFMLSTSPGGINFESSPFKLTREYLEVMDSDDTGMASEAFNYYKVLCIQGYLAVRKHAERIILLVEMMSASGCPCFKAGAKVMNNLRKRFNLGCTEEQCVEIMLSMISDSMDAWCTRQYDFYQRVLNGIL
jgi:hypothetical protein